MIYNVDDICMVNGSYLTDELNEVFKPWQTGEPDRDLPLMEKAAQVDHEIIEMNTQAGIRLWVEYNDYSAQLLAGDDCELLCAGSIDNGGIYFEHEFALACVKAIKEWW